MSVGHSFIGQGELVMGKSLSRSFSIAAYIAVIISGPLTGLAQSGGTVATSSPSGVSEQQLSKAFAALQQLLQSGILNPDQTQRATSLLTAVKSALAGGTLNSTQVRQIGQAIAAARKTQQLNTGAGPILSRTGGLLDGSASNTVSSQQLNIAFAAV